jgi:hypothetical protein
LTYPPRTTVIPAHAGTHDVTVPERRQPWVPASAGMTGWADPSVHGSDDWYHLPENPRRVLEIGCGEGFSAGVEGASDIVPASFGFRASPGLALGA